MHRVILAALAVATVATGCAQQIPDQKEVVEVERQGSSLSGQTIGIAALLRVRGDQTLGPLRLRVSFRDNDGDVVDETEDSLPYCPPQSDCWWGGRFGLMQFQRPSEIVRATVDAIGDPEPYTAPAELLTFSVSPQPDGRVLGRAPRDEGYAYVIAFDADRPRWGTWRGVRGEDMRSVTFAASEFPDFRDEVRLRAFFYAGTITPGD